MQKYPGTGDVPERKEVDKELANRVEARVRAAVLLDAQEEERAQPQRPDHHHARQQLLPGAQRAEGARRRIVQGGAHNCALGDSTGEVKEFFGALVAEYIARGVDQHAIVNGRRDASQHVHFATSAAVGDAL